MSLLALIRWCGTMAALSGVLLLISDVLELFVLSSGGAPEAGAGILVAGLYLLATLLLSLGLVGLYADQAELSGVPGLLGFLAAFVGTALVSGTFWAQAFFAPAVAEAAPAFLYGELPGSLGAGFVGSFLLFALGWAAFGIFTYRAGVRPRWAAVLLIVGAVLVVLPLPFNSLVFDTAVIWVGSDLFLKGERAARHKEEAAPAGTHV